MRCVVHRGVLRAKERAARERRRGRRRAGPDAGAARHGPARAGLVTIRPPAPAANQRMRICKSAVDALRAFAPAIDAKTRRDEPEPAATSRNAVKTRPKRGQNAAKTRPERRGMAGRPGEIAASHAWPPGVRRAAA
ncbi:hypothetical protein L810_3040 [Burkholderia sp. AU4i]|nr:hypothetical protein L810_3040 [Burkholderia sp. AU4i]